LIDTTLITVSLGSIGPIKPADRRRCSQVPLIYLYQPPPPPKKNLVKNVLFKNAAQMYRGGFRNNFHSQFCICFLYMQPYAIFFLALHFILLLPIGFLPCHSLSVWRILLGIAQPPILCRLHVEPLCLQCRGDTPGSSNTVPF
jgi:hypothetical protein